jgi:hypothetical protein
MSGSRQVRVGVKRDGNAAEDTGGMRVEGVSGRYVGAGAGGKSETGRVW